MNAIVQEQAVAALAFALSSLVIPPLGSRLEGQGGTFEALMKGENGAHDYLLILAEPQHDQADWKTNLDWARGLDIEGNRDFDLPTRRELNALRANAKDRFHDDWYWSNEPNGSGYAWCQDFTSGYQDWFHQSDYGIRGCAVRRIPILR